jgi:hypothetical protein
MKAIATIGGLFLSGCAPAYAGTLETVATTIYGEAANQDYNGKHAVASVIWNRANATPSKFRAVCLSPHQFSCWQKRVFTLPMPDLRKPQDRSAWRDCVALADSMMNGTFLPSIKVKDYAEKSIKNYWSGYDACRTNRGS